MRRWQGVAMALAAAASPAALAQTPSDATSGDSGDRAGKITRIAPELIAFNAMLEFKLKKHNAETCDAMGCLYIVNETDDYDAVALYLDTGTPSPRDLPVWGPNLLPAKLKPHAARWTYKAGDETMCTLSTLVVLRQRRTGEEVTSKGEVSLCKSPRLDSALRINVSTFSPRATVEDPAAP